MSYKIQETYVNRDRGYIWNQTEIVETNIESLGELFRNCQKEFGRCESKMFVDTANPQNPAQIGWVFVSRKEYEGLNHYHEGDRTYLQEVWVTVYSDSGDKLFQN